MSLEINTNGGMPQMLGDVCVPGMATDASQIQQKGVEAAQSVAAVLGDVNVQVSRTSGVNGAQGTNPTTSVPELDEADEAKAGKVDLDALVAYLQMQMDEEMAETQKQRIDSLKGQLKSAHDTQMAKIDKSIEEAKKQEEAAKAKKALSWLSAIFAVVAAIVVTVATGGLAAGLAWAGAAIAVGSAIMNETGATKAICKAMSASIREGNHNLSKAEADAIASGIFAACELVLGLACGIGGGVAAGGAAVKNMGTVVKLTMSISQGVIQTGNLATTAASTAIGYQAGMAQADATENQAYLQKIQKMLEESEDDLQTILDQLSATFGDLLALLESKTDTANKINQEIGMLNA